LTQALSQDQIRAIVELVGEDLSTRITPVICDGDTSSADRVAIQKGFGNIIITNPDMLHHTLLPDVRYCVSSRILISHGCTVDFPQHKHWQRIFQRLRWVVIDEAHQYRQATSHRAYIDVEFS
jgi:DEAD/DEAH box helicase domain-containing protein